MTAEATWAIAMRAESLAKLFLTRSSRDIEILTASTLAEMSGFDLLVRILSATTSETPKFGVEAKGTRQALSGRQALPQFRKITDKVHNTDLPVCLFLFNVETEKGIYRWLREPIIEDGNNSRLRTNIPSYPGMKGRHGEGGDQAPFEVLDDAGVNYIFDRVVSWYKAKGQQGREPYRFD